MKNAINQWVFKMLTPLFYMWFNIVTRGHKEAPKSQNIAVGPEDPPPGNYQDPKLRVTKGQAALGKNAF